MFPSGLNFTQVNPLIQQPEKRVKSSDLQALRVLWERSNCPRLNSPSARHLFPSCLLLLTPCIPPSFLPGLKAWDGKREKISPLLILNISGIDPPCTCGGRGEQRRAHELVLGNEELNHPLKHCVLSSPGRALLIRSAVRRELALISSQPGRCHAPFDEGSPSSPRILCAAQIHLSQVSWERETAYNTLVRGNVCFQPWSANKQIRIVSCANDLKPEDQAPNQNSGYLSTGFWRGLTLGQRSPQEGEIFLDQRGEPCLFSFFRETRDLKGLCWPFLSCSAPIQFLPLWKELFSCFCYVQIFLSQDDCGHCLYSLFW